MTQSQVGFLYGSLCTRDALGLARPHLPDAGLTCGWERKNGEMDVELPRLPGKRNAMRPF